MHPYDSDQFQRTPTPDFLSFLETRFFSAEQDENPKIRNAYPLDKKIIIYIKYTSYIPSSLNSQDILRTHYSQCLKT